MSKRDRRSPYIAVRHDGRGLYSAVLWRLTGTRGMHLAAVTSPKGTLDDAKVAALRMSSTYGAEVLPTWPFPATGPRLEGPA